MWMYALNHYQLYLLVLLRMVAFVSVAPIMSFAAWPSLAKLGMGAFLALLVTPVVTGHVPSALADPADFTMVALKETIIGLVLGLLASMLFSAVTMVGQLFDVQIGLNAATLFDPQSGGSSTLIGSFQSMLFTLYFLGMNGLDGLVLMLMNSYNLVPLGQLHLPSSIWAVMTHAVGLALALAVQMAVPTLVALLLTDITFALLARTVPQMNVFVVGLPGKLFVGLAVTAVVMPGIVYMFGRLFEAVFNELNGVLNLIGGNAR
ncbi:MAG: flagellar biosynthetic protein FliR [Alicyclobacillus sp.]|nr:flagellar biosynthetic protein FliR [Alicyclobacillus sp.]